MSGIPAVELTKLVAERSQEICAALDPLAPDELEAPSAMPEWSRLTIVCHLRYGAQATRQITEATLAGRRSAFYPGGRELQRPYTLQPALGESPIHVVESLHEECASLAALWAEMGDRDWLTVAREHEETPHLGDVGLFDLALLRLTEVDRHSADLQLGLEPSPVQLGDEVLDQRIEQLRSGWEC